MKWLIVEDALRDRKGHWLEYISTFVRGFTALGDEVTVLCDRKAEGFILEQTGAYPVLPDSIWHRMGDGAGTLKRYLRVPRHALATFFAMLEFFRNFNHNLALGQVFVPTVLVHHFLGWWLLLKTGSVPSKSRVLLFFPNLPIGLDDSGQASWSSGPTTKLMAWLFASLRKEVGSGRVVLGVETHAMRRALESLIGMKVVYLPHPVEFHAETPRRGGKKSPEVLTNEDTESTEEYIFKQQASALATQAGASESDSLTSKLADSPVSESPKRFAVDPAASEYLKLNSYKLKTPPMEAAKTLASPIIFGCYGAARWEKGSDVFQEAIKLILKNEVVSEKWPVAGGDNHLAPVTHDLLPVAAGSRSLRFAIQWVEDFTDDHGHLVKLDPWLKNHPQVEVIGRYFEGGEYERQLERTDVMVLPYRSPYRLRVSRVVIEAMMHDMPVIATHGTTLFEQAEEFGEVVGCEDGNAESLARAILEGYTKFNDFHEFTEFKKNVLTNHFSIANFKNIQISS
jgi:glycosyltransferase involved in cell wall biosynthesis